jgi:hypothetical protein
MLPEAKRWRSSSTAAVLSVLTWGAGAELEAYWCDNCLKTATGSRRTVFLQREDAASRNMALGEL